MLTSVIYLAASFGVFARKTWALYTLLVLGYLGLLNAGLELINGNKAGWIGAWINFTIVKKGHEATGLRRQLQDAHNSLHKCRTSNPIAGDRQPLFNQNLTANAPVSLPQR